MTMKMMTELFNRSYSDEIQALIDDLELELEAIQRTDIPNDATSLA